MIAPTKRYDEHVLLTIGYEGLDLASFLKYLAWHKVDVLVDVRESALSRKRGFSKTGLADAVEKTGIQYIHIPQLGSPRSIRNRLHQDWNYEAFFEAYNDYIDRQAHAIELLADIVDENRRVCLMCFEKDPERCHRTLLADHIIESFGSTLKLEPIKI